MFWPKSERFIGHQSIQLFEVVLANCRLLSSLLSDWEMVIDLLFFISSSSSSLFCEAAADRLF